MVTIVDCKGIAIFGFDQVFFSSFGFPTKPQHIHASATWKVKGFSHGLTCTYLQRDPKDWILAGLLDKKTVSVTLHEQWPAHSPSGFGTLDPKKTHQ